MKRSITAMVGACLLWAAGARAQDAALKRADTYFNTQDYHTASRMYEQILLEKPQNGISKFKAGVCYLFTSQPERGLSYIKESANLPLQRDFYYDFWLGRAYHLNMKIDSALMSYRRYLAAAGPRDEYRKGVKDLIAQAHRTESFFMSSDNSPFEAVNAGEGINSPYTERNPMVTADEQVLVFASRRPVFPDEKPAFDGEYSEKIFVAQRQADGTWGRATATLLPEDRKTYYRPIQLIESDRKLLLVMPGKNGGLFVAEREGATFKMPYRLNENIKPVYLNLEVSFSPDMKRMLFTRTSANADNSDIYLMEKNSAGNWGAPKKLPAMVNTNEDELSPTFVDGGQAFVFASKGHTTFGGFDVFKATLDGNKVTKVDNLGLPINGPGNDIGQFEISSTPKVSYLSSARAKGFGEADLYRITYTLPTSQK